MTLQKLKDNYEKDIKELKEEKHKYKISEYVVVKELIKSQYENACKDIELKELKIQIEDFKKNQNNLKYLKTINNALETKIQLLQGDIKILQFLLHH